VRAIWLERRISGTLSGKRLQCVCFKQKLIRNQTFSHYIVAIKEGAKFGRYEIRRLIGAGGMGEVYLAYDTQLRRQVALKILPADIAADSDRLARFEREAYAASSLNHPNILTIYEIGVTHGLNFIATEFIDGASLRERLAREKLELDLSLDIAVQVASALAAAHSTGIIHRDIKPENIMLRGDGYVKVLDFGLAKLTEKPAIDSQADTQTMTQTSPGMVLGTAGYMSPEQARGFETDTRTDIWSLGCVLYEMLAGFMPFAGETVSDVIAAIIHKEPPPIARFARYCPEELQRIVTKTLQKDREERYQSIKELGLDLKSLKRRLEFEAELERSVAPDKPDGSAKPVVTEVIAPKVTTVSSGNRDALLLTEFTNLAGDPVFDGTLKMALAVTLEQSPFLDIFSETKVRQTLSLMGRAADEPVTRELGHEICLRRGLKAYIAGTIASLGTTYVLTLEAVNAQSGETIGRQLEQAESKEQVLKALGRAATGLRERLGENLSSIDRFDASLELTTSSLEALKVYSLALEQTLKGNVHESIPLYKRAIELDPNFAYAYIGLAVQYANTDQPKLAAEYVSRAFQLRDRVSELEKLRITSFYYLYVSGELDKLIETLELYKRTYPRDARAFGNLSHSYEVIGQFERAAEAAREALRLEPSNVSGYVNLAGTLVKMNRLVEAREVCEQAFERNIDGVWLHEILYQTAFIEDDTAEMQKQLAWFDDQPHEYIALNLQTGAAAFKGGWRESQNNSRRAVDLAARSGARGVAAGYAIEQALRIVFWSSGAGLPSIKDNKLQLALKTQTQKALSLERNRITLAHACLALALTGQAPEANKLIEELKSEYPKDTLITFLWLPLALAAIELQNDKPEEAIEILESAERFERAAEFYPQYLRGLAYLKLNDGSKATAEFQKIIEHRGESPLSVLYPLAHLGAARALLLTANKQESRKRYEEFFELWKDADKDMPLLAAAKSEIK
jgi:eukaryotic-like serine/threonine-protein kinase